MRPLPSALVVLFLILSLPASALESGLQWETFGPDEGLSSSSVTAIAQDEIGYLWFSTQSGLNRWDGYSMRVWQKEPFSKNTLSHNLIQTMMIDQGSIIWLGTYGGLDRFNSSTETFQSFRHQDSDPQTLSNDVVTRVYRDERKQLWVGTLDGLNRLDEKTGTFTRYLTKNSAEPGVPGKTIRSLVEDFRGQLWVGSSGGLDLYDAARDRFVPLSSLFPQAKLPPGAVMGAVRLPGDKNLWLAIWGQGLVRLDPATGSMKLYPLADNRVFGLNRGEAGELHAGTWGGGLVVFRPTTGENFAFLHDSTRVDSLAHDVVYGTFQDRGGLIWVATNGGSVSRYNPRRQQFPFVEMGGKVLDILQTSDSSLWAGVYNRGLVQITGDGKQRVWHHDPRDPNSLRNDIVNDIIQDGQGNLLIATNDGVSSLNPRTGLMGPWPEFADTGRTTLSGEVINGLDYDKTGNLWISTFRMGLLRTRVQDGRWQEKVYQTDPKNPSALPSNLVYFTRQDREDRIWVATNGGLAVYRPSTDDFLVMKYEPENPQSLPGNSVKGWLEDSKGRFWVAINGGGLSRVDPLSGVQETFGLKDGLTNLSVYSVMEDSSGLLWLASANGLFSFRPETKTFRRYGLADGLSSAEFSNGSLNGRDGKLWFGGLKGLFSLHPGRLSMVDSQPLVALTGVQVQGHARPVSANLTLGWQENSVTFSFSALDFRNPSKNLYAYQLEGFDREWVQAGTRHEASYTNLWPGTYRFRFKGSNPSEDWSESSQSVSLTVESAPWASWYAWVLYATAFLGVVFLYQRARISWSLGHKVSELEMLRSQLEQANSRLDQLARLDGLTSIPNRRALDTWLLEEWSRAQRQRHAVCILMLDIDDFKRYNDFYGHLAGDNCLKAVAQTMASHLHRNSDFCARYGGEEFVVVLHDTELEGGLTVAQRLSESIDLLAMPHQMATAQRFVTVSIGVASQIPGIEHSVDDLLRRADQALYRAKALGRHRIEASSPV